MEGLMLEALESFVVRPDHPGRFPLVLVTHGTPGVDGDAFFREILNRSPVGYSKAAVAFAQRGYAVVSIMRRGFGRSGGGFPPRMSSRRSFHCGRNPGLTLTMSSCLVTPQVGLPSLPRPRRTPQAWWAS